MGSQSWVDGGSYCKCGTKAKQGLTKDLKAGSLQAVLSWSLPGHRSSNSEADSASGPSDPAKASRASFNEQVLSSIGTG